MPSFDNELLVIAGPIVAVLGCVARPIPVLICDPRCVVYRLLEFIRIALITATLSAFLFHLSIILFLLPI